MRWLGAAQVLRTRLVPKPPAPRVDALLLTALALLWPQARAPYAEHTLVDQFDDVGAFDRTQAAQFVDAEHGVLFEYVAGQHSLLGIHDSYTPRAARGLKGIAAAIAR